MLIKFELIKEEKVLKFKVLEQNAKLTTAVIRDGGFKFSVSCKSTKFGDVYEDKLIVQPFEINSKNYPEIRGDNRIFIRGNSTLRDSEITSVIFNSNIERDCYHDIVIHAFGSLSEKYKSLL